MTIKYTIITNVFGPFFDYVDQYSKWMAVYISRRDGQITAYAPCT